MSDDAPALLQPTITCNKAMAWVPVSLRAFEDSDIAQQIGTVFTDSKMQLEANAFTLGTGTPPEPKGIITAVSAVGRLGRRYGGDGVRRGRAGQQPERAPAALASAREVHGEPLGHQRLPHA